MISALFTDEDAQHCVEFIPLYLKHYLSQYAIPTLPKIKMLNYLETDIGLVLDQGLLYLFFLGNAKAKPIQSEFISTQNIHRLHAQKIQHELLIKASGLNKRRGLSVLDATAGLGRDSLILAAGGGVVTMRESNPVIAALLENGMAHVSESETLLRALMQNISFEMGNSQAIAQEYDVIYLDPMFPERQKTAKVKKEMSAFHTVVESPLAEDEAALFATAKKYARKRIVVKRPPKASLLAEQKPSYQIESKACRFDVYLNFI